MSTNRLLKVTVAIVLVVVGLLAVQPFVKASIASSANHLYTQSKEQALAEYQLGERYGQTPGNADRREYQLGERYGVTPLNVDRQYLLGERYGQTPSSVDREYWLGERYGVTP